MVSVQVLQKVCRAGFWLKKKKKLVLYKPELNNSDDPLMEILKPVPKR